jgi:membrane fusion protein, multidrug efflux system
MRKRMIMVVSVLIVATGGGLAAERFHGAAEPTQAAPAETTVPVVAGTVKSGEVPIYLRGVGTAIASNNVIVRSQITGQVIRIAFTQGQTVKKGDLLAEIDPRAYQAQLDQAIANRDRDQAQELNAEANLNRYLPLEQKGFASRQLLDTQKAQLAQLKAMVKSDEAIIVQARTNLSYTRLTAPIAGVTGIRQIDEGNVIHPSDPNGLVDVTQVQPISLIFTLPQTEFVEIQRQLAKGPLTVLAYSQDDKTKLDEGKLDLIDNQIVQTTGTIRLRASFANSKHLLWPGELVNAQLLLETRTGGLTIAAAAVQQGPNGTFVWVIGSDGRVQPRPVTVAQMSDGQALIASGLRANEKVVVDGSSTAKPLKKPTYRAPWSSKSHEHLGPLHPSPDRNRAAHGRPAAGRTCDLPFVAGGSAPKRQFPDDSGHGPAPGRRSPDHGVIGCNPARAAILANTGYHAADIVKCPRLHAGCGAVQPQP